MDLDDLSTAAGVAEPPGATTHGPAAKALLEGAEYDAEQGDAAEASESAAAAAGRAAEDGPGAAAKAAA